MGNEVMDLMANELSLVRLDGIVIKGEEYREIAAQLEDAFQGLMSEMPEERKQDLEIFRASMFRYADLYRKEAYKLGMSDMRELLMSGQN